MPHQGWPHRSVELNRRLQAILNPPAPDKPQIIWEQSGRVLRCGDKVMQIKNDYDIPYERDGAEAGVGAYNGDMGIITAVDPESRAVTVQMDDRKYIYGADQLAELEPAYAVTVHKSQGSEFPAVIMPVADVPRAFVTATCCTPGLPAHAACAFWREPGAPSRPWWIMCARTCVTAGCATCCARQSLRLKNADETEKTHISGLAGPWANGSGTAAGPCYPRHCPLCGTVLEQSAWKAAVCRSCIPEAERLRHLPPRLPVTEHTFYAVNTCAAAFYYADSVRHAILLCKENGNPWYARELADLMAVLIFGAQPARAPGYRPVYENLSGISLYSAIVPVPPRVKKNRAENMPLLLAQRLGRILHIPVIQRCA